MRRAMGKENSSALFSCIFCLLFGANANVNAVDPADLILLNGNIYTVNERQPQAEAVAVAKDHIIFVGGNDDAKKLATPQTRIVDLAGKTVVPGLTDSHCHIFGIGEREMHLNLEGTNTRDDFLRKVKERVAQTEPGKWVVGHASVVNTAALKIAKIDKHTPEPFGGQILKTKAEPNGMLLDHAQDLVAQKIPKPTEAEREQELLVGIEREIKLGWCEIQNAGSTREDVDLFRKAFDAGKIKIRLINAVYGPGEYANTVLRTRPIVNAYDHHFTQRTIKIIFDGALGSRGAALLQPYSDAPETSGYLTAKPEELRPMLKEALRRGIQIETHAIGDRANRLILDLYEEAFHSMPSEQKTIPRPRWRVEHAQIVDPADLPRFAKLGVIPSMQPSHAISDLFFAPARLGLDRLAGAYAWKSLLDSGAIVCGGSDAPVERGEPMIEFYAAVARKSIKGESGDGWHPEQAVTREQALKMFTMSPAYAAFEEAEKGSIEPGKLADFTVLSNDIMKIPEPEILKTRCEMTIIGGEIVFGD